MIAAECEHDWTTDSHGIRYCAHCRKDKPTERMKTYESECDIIGKVTAALENMTGTHRLDRLHENTAKRIIAIVREHDRKTEEEQE